MISALFLPWVHIQSTPLPEYFFDFRVCEDRAAPTAANPSDLIDTIAPTTGSPQPSGPSPSPTARNVATEQGSNTVAAAVADSTGATNAAGAPAAYFLTLLSPPSVPAASVFVESA